MIRARNLTLMFNFCRDLSSNNIQNLTKDAFSTLWRLEHLYDSHNSI